MKLNKDIIEKSFTLGLMMHNANYYPMLFLEWLNTEDITILLVDNVWNGVIMIMLFIEPRKEKVHVEFLCHSLKNIEVNQHKTAVDT